MKGRLFLLAGVWVVISVAALAQPADPPADPDPAPAAPEAAPTPTPGPTPPDETRPTRVLTPTPDRQREEAGEPLTPLRPGPVQPDTDMMLEPGVQPVEPEALEAEERLLPEDVSRKRWRITPLLAAEVYYDDNIFLTNADRVSDVIWTPSFGAIYELGDFREHKENYLSAQWIGQPVIYTKNSDQNGFNQYAALALQYRFTKLVIKLDSTFSIVRGSSRDVNTITTTTTFWNSLAFSYDYSDKTAFDLNFTQTTSNTDNFQNTNQYQVRGGMNYQLFPKTRVGLQGVAGILDSSDTPLQYLQQALVQVIYSGTEKLSFLFSGGVQALEFEDRDEVKVTPVFSLGLTYQPFPSTSISLLGFRNTVASSAEAGQDYYATGFEINISQQFFQKVVAALSFGYENDAYFETTPDTPTDRVDNYVFVRPRLTYAFVDWFSVSVWYEFRQTASTEEINSFYNNRAGLEILTKF
jgi:Putative beta-barrel porin 2